MVENGWNPEMNGRLYESVTAARVKTLGLLNDMARSGFAADTELSAAVSDIQAAAIKMGDVATRLHRERAAGASVGAPPEEALKIPPRSQDAAIVLGLAATAMPFAASVQDEAERWLRVLRLYGEVGNALQALGVPEGPLETLATMPDLATGKKRSRGDDVVGTVSHRAGIFAARRDASTTGTVDILFAIIAVYSSAFERALYTRGTSQQELLAKLPADRHSEDRVRS